MTLPILELRRIDVSADNRTILAIDDFALGAGQSIALVGPNGAGKTTLLHVAALLRPAESGSVVINGQTVTAANARALRRSIAVVFQDSLLFSVSVMANTAAGLRFQGMERKEAESVAREWLRRFGVDHLERRHARGLSGGEASRVVLARAFATSPSLLLLDEPFSALDAPTRATLVPELRRHLQHTGTAAILVSHDLEEAFAFTDRLAVMEHGRLLAEGDAAALVAQPPSRRVAELLAVDNILPATVEEPLPGRCWSLTLESGQRARARASGNLGFKTGDRVVVTFPASSGGILPPGERAPVSWNHLAGTITARTPHRYGWLLSISIPDRVTVLERWTTEKHAWHIGDRVVIAFPIEATAVLPA